MDCGDDLKQVRLPSPNSITHSRVLHINAPANTTIAQVNLLEIENEGNVRQVGNRRLHTFDGTEKHHGPADNLAGASAADYGAPAADYVMKAFPLLMPTQCLLTLY